MLEGIKHYVLSFSDSYLYWCLRIYVRVPPSCVYTS